MRYGSLHGNVLGINVVCNYQVMLILVKIFICAILYQIIIADWLYTCNVAIGLVCMSNLSKLIFYKLRTV